MLAVKNPRRRMLHNSLIFKVPWHSNLNKIYYLADLNLCGNFNSQRISYGF